MIKRLTSIAALLCMALIAGAQGYTEALRRNLWNESRNAAGLREDSVSVSTAQLYGSYRTGEFRTPDDAKSDWRIGARAGSVMHLDKFSMKGTFGFEQLIANEMCGSMFLHPGYYPINVYEFTPGSKTGQTYSFGGGISVDLAPCWRIGGTIDFESANIAKRKDLRHTNYRLDMDVSPSLQYHKGKFALGINYIFSRNSETVTAEQIGSSTAGYEAFFDKGLFYGTKQLWQGSGVHLAEAGVSGLPVRENMNGVGLQMAFDGLFLDVQWRKRNGEAGEKQYIWYKFPGWDLSAKLGYIKFGEGDSYHRVVGSFSILNGKNTEAVLEKTTRGGVTVVENYGYNILSERRNIYGGAEYEFFNEKWTVRAALSFNIKQMRVTPMYPYVANQTLLTPCAALYGKVRLGKFDLSLDAAIDKGFLSDMCLSVADAGCTTVPVRLTPFFESMAAIDSCCRLSLAPALRFNFFRGLYIQASALLVRGFGMQLPGNSRITATALFGYNF